MICAATRPTYVTSDEQLGLSTSDAFCQNPGQWATPMRGPPPKRAVPDLSSQRPASDLDVLDGRHDTMRHADRLLAHRTAEFRLAFTPSVRSRIHKRRLCIKIFVWQVFDETFEGCRRNLWTAVDVGSGLLTQVRAEITSRYARALRKGKG